MSTRSAPGSPAPSARRPVSEPDSLSSLIAAWTRKLFTHPSWAVAVLWLAGGAAVALTLVRHHWHTSSLVILVVVICLTIVISIVRITIGAHLPRWTLQVDAGLGTTLISVVLVMSDGRHVDLGNLYLLVVLFVILYLSLRTAIVHILTAGAAYALVLFFGPRPSEPPVIAWLAVFGTATVLSVVVIGLMSVLRVAAQEDHLTGLANRRMWDERLEEELARARRSGEALSVIMIDLDDFKIVNDNSGHDAGDILLMKVAENWKAVIRGGGDFLARLGGDEFGLIAPGSDEVSIRYVARRIEDALPKNLTASIGVATWDRSENASDLLRRADQVMYFTKRNHRKGGGLYSA